MDGWWWYFCTVKFQLNFCSIKLDGWWWHFCIFVQFKFLNVLKFFWMMVCHPPSENCMLLLCNIIIILMVLKIYCNHAASYVRTQHSFRNWYQEKNKKNKGASFFPYIMTGMEHKRFCSSHVPVNRNREQQNIRVLLQIPTKQTYIDISKFLFMLHQGKSSHHYIRLCQF